MNKILARLLQDHFDTMTNDAIHRRLCEIAAGLIHAANEDNIQQHLESDRRERNKLLQSRMRLWRDGLNELIVPWDD